MWTVVCVTVKCIVQWRCIKEFNKSDHQHKLRLQPHPIHVNETDQNRPIDVVEEGDYNDYDDDNDYDLVEERNFVTSFNCYIIYRHNTA
jgi:hypothetical protein